MSITTPAELSGMQRVSHAVATTLRRMREYAQEGMSTLELDAFGAELLQEFGAKSAPMLTYQFPGHTCISVNDEVAHGIPNANRILKSGDLVNIDVSAELDGFWADNGGSFVLGEGDAEKTALVKASQEILREAIYSIRGGVRVAEVGRLIEQRARKAGYKVIRNLAGHGVGRSLHESPEDILNCYDRYNKERFRQGSVVAIETFIATRSTVALTQQDGWTLKGNRGGYVAQHEHTMVVTDGEPMILTEANAIW